MAQHPENRLSAQIAERIRAAAVVPKSRKAFDNIVGACDYLEQQRLAISVASVGRLCETKYDGPATQSIRNNPDFRAFVQARQAEQPSIGSPRQAGRVAIRTGDINIDAHIQTLEFELMRAKNELRSLRQALPQLGNFDLNTALEKGCLVIRPPAVDVLTDSAKSAIQVVLDSNALSSVGLEFVKTGQIIAPAQNDAVFLTKTQVDALRTLLRAGAQGANRT